MPLKRMLLLMLLFFVSIIRAEEDYFPSTDNLTWDQARLYCQICYKELTTITPINAQSISDKMAKQNDSDYWIGLRQNLSGSKLWSQWSNGNPVIYQNWYPGHPVPKKKPVPLPTCPTPTVTPRPEMTIEQCPTWQRMLDCLNSSNCSLTDCSTTAVPSTPTTLLTSTKVPTTHPAQLSADSNQPDLEYIEDSCVSMLSFGMWMEKACNKSLPYICYDDRFFGNLSFMPSNATLSWSAAPGNISEYILKTYRNKPSTNVSVNKTTVKSYANETIFKQHLDSLVSGVLYTVQVIPVKCDRQLNPQNISFYTQPDQINNLTVVNVTTNQINLSWSKPDGECEFYYINISSRQNQHESENCLNQMIQHTITNLTPGGLYHIKVSAVINNSYGIPTSIDVYTKPSKVENLIFYSNTEDTFSAAWNSSDSNANAYLYNIDVIENNKIVNNTTTNQTNVTLKNLTSGTRYTFTVFALVNDTVHGDKVSNFTYTRPERVKDLWLTASTNQIIATWDSTSIKFNFFLVQVYPCNSNNPKFNCSISANSTTFSEVYAAKCYNVTIINYINETGPSSSLTNKLIYTLPVKPGAVDITNISTNLFIVTWDPPVKVDNEDITYIVTWRSDFWNTKSNDTVKGKNSLNCSGLHSGTDYTVDVYVQANESRSEPSTQNGMTVHKPRYLTFKMLCTSQDQDNQCNNADTQLIFPQLKRQFQSTFNTTIFWNLSLVDG